MDESNNTQSPHASLSEIEVVARQLRKFVHDLRSPLSVISNGLNILDAIRVNEEEFLMVRDMMKTAETEMTEMLNQFANQSITSR